MSRTLYRTTIEAIQDRIIARLKAQPPDQYLTTCPTCKNRWDVRAFSRCPVCRIRRNGKES